MLVWEIKIHTFRLTVSIRKREKEEVMYSISEDFLVTFYEICPVLARKECQQHRVSLISDPTHLSQETMVSD